MHNEAGGRDHTLQRREVVLPRRQGRGIGRLVAEEGTDAGANARGVLRHDHDPARRRQRCGGFLERRYRIGELLEPVGDDHEVERVALPERIGRGGDGYGVRTDTTAGGEPRINLRGVGRPDRERACPEQ